MTDSSRNAATIGTNLFYNFDCTLVTAEVQRFFPVKSGVLTNYSKFFSMIAYTQLFIVLAWKKLISRARMKVHFKF